MAMFLTVLPLGAVFMVFYVGALRTTAICSVLLMTYILIPFIYIGALSFQHAEASLTSAWQGLMEVNILSPLILTAAVLGMWIAGGIILGAVLKFAWARSRSSRLA